MTKQKIILFDIDYTLFDVAKFREKIFMSIINAVEDKEKKNIKKNLEEIYSESRNKIGYFKMDSFLKDVNRKFNLNISLGFLNNKIFSDNLYEETKDILKLISKDKSIMIGIFSGGESSFQLKKIEEIDNFFNKKHIHVLKYKHLDISKIIKKYKNFKAYLIDDMLNILYSAKQVDNKMITIWIKRGRFARDAKPINKFKPDYEITNLHELTGIIKKN